MGDYPRFKKADDHTLLVEEVRSNPVALFNLLQHRDKLEAEKGKIEMALEKVEEMIAEAKKLGITPKEPEQSPKK